MQNNQPVREAAIALLKAVGVKLENVTLRDEDQAQSGEWRLSAANLEAYSEIAEDSDEDSHSHAGYNLAALA